jgi:putative tryptophan/tyrosine transport system substrate-binding protein
MSDMRRREFITLLGGAAAGWPLTARAQNSDRLRRVGVLMAFTESDAEIRARVTAFRQELRKLGWAEGSNLTIEERWPADNMDRVRADAAELVELKPDAILVAGRRAISALQQATRSVPVVIAGTSDPVEQGIVASLARPGGNFTGFGLVELSIIGKMLETLKEIAPTITRVAFIFNPDNASAVYFSRSFPALAAPLAIEPSVLPIHHPAEIERAISTFARKPNGAVLFPGDVTLTINRQLVITQVSQHRLPAIYGDPVFVSSGGLMFYGPDRVDLYRRAASYVDRILRGEKPGDLPVQQPTKFKLMINLKAAKALGLTVPDKLLVAADEVIE